MKPEIHFPGPSFLESIARHPLLPLEFRYDWTPKTCRSNTKLTSGEISPGFPGLRLGFPGLRLGFPGLRLGFPGLRLGFPGRVVFWKTKTASSRPHTTVLISWGELWQPYGWQKTQQKHHSNNQTIKQKHQTHQTPHKKNNTYRLIC